MLFRKYTTLWTTRYNSTVPRLCVKRKFRFLSWNFICSFCMSFFAVLLVWGGRVNVTVPNFFLEIVKSTQISLNSEENFAKLRIYVTSGALSYQVCLISWLPYSHFVIYTSKDIKLYLAQSQCRFPGDVKASWWAFLFQHSSYIYCLPVHHETRYVRTTTHAHNSRTAMKTHAENYPCTKTEGQFEWSWRSQNTSCKYGKLLLMAFTVGNVTASS